MQCPVCKNPMVVLELEKVEIDHCVSCGGIWLDTGELELLLEDSLKKNDLLASFVLDTKCGEKSRKCPRCARKMDKVLCGIDKKALIDKCPHNHGLWFDLGELDEIIRMGSFDKDNKVIRLLEDMFGKKNKK
ncbi:MAG: zf-TFIIB domain-containing protein [bacterium]